MAKKIEFEIEVRPLQGASFKKTVKLAATGVTPAEVLKQAGIDPAHMTIRVDGKEVDLNHHIGVGASITVSANAPPPATKVTATERPQGS